MMRGKYTIRAARWLSAVALMASLPAASAAADEPIAIAYAKDPIPDGAILLFTIELLAINERAADPGVR